MSTESEPLVEDEEPNKAHLYPQWMTLPLQYTCLAPFLSCIVAITTGFYGLALCAFCLGMTSISWWWYPLRGRVTYKHIDRVCVICCVLYAFHVESQIRGEHRTLWRVCLCSVCGSVLTNECMSLYVRTYYSEAEFQQYFLRYILTVHGLCAHLMMNTFCCILMVSYVVVNGEESIKFRNESDGPAASVVIGHLDQSSSLMNNIPFQHPHLRGRH